MVGPLCNPRVVCVAVAAASIAATLYPTSHMKQPRSLCIPPCCFPVQGVSWSSSCHKWAAVIWDRVSKKARHVGVYGSEEEAARAYDREVIATQGAKNTGLNFRDSVDLYRSEVGEPPAAAEGSAAATKHNSSEYRGVSWHERSKRWEARAWGSGRQHFVGSFSSAAEAARAYDKAILKLGGAGPKSASRLNFPLTDYDLQEIANMNFPVVSQLLHDF
eukprot:GHUV01012063.1.p1 GENE.GHUV01012063.1~~GHUV01012063.1.p1  ORF type:complete len:218 (+),score=60.12 GHUV01012063.1:206-859(+)